MLLSPITNPSSTSTSPRSPIVEDLHCPLCFNRFRREDHLQRHLLSHGFPKFQCEHKGCGMRFHRKDVLKRHQEVHKAHPTKTRRKPRRGILPEGPIQMMFNHEIDPNAIPLTTQNVAALSAGPSLPLESQPEPYINMMVTQAPTPAESQMGPILDVTAFQMMNGYTQNMDGGHIPTSMASPLERRMETSHLDPNLQMGMSEQLQLPSPMGSFNGIVPSSPRPDTVLHICINAFRNTVLPRVPHIHSSAFDTQLPPDLEYAMACLGARHVAEFRDGALDFWRQGIELLKTPPINPLRRLQAQLLLISYAIWSNDSDMLQWSKREQQAVLDTIMSLTANAEPGVKHDSWESWKAAEERKRTVLAFYVITILSSIFMGHPPFFWSELVKEDLPCDNLLWTCTNEWEWSNIYHQSTKSVSFQEACFALLARDTTHNAVYESTSPYGQLILLCAVAESINLSKRFPMNFASVEGFQRGDITEFVPFERFLETLNIWKDLWWLSSETLWNPQHASHPRIEATGLYGFIVLQLYNYENFHDLSDDAKRAIMETSLDVFTGVSKSGFLEVASVGFRAFSPCSYRCVVAFAQSMDNWFQYIIEYTESGQQLRKEDEKILARVRQAVRRSVGTGYVTRTKMQYDSLHDLRTEASGLWQILLSV